MTDVLIAGAGPVGLFLAYRLTTAGHTVRLIESRGAQSSDSKALAIMPRTLETFRIAGIASAFENAAHRVGRGLVLSHQRELGRIELDIPGSWYDYVALIPQDVTERILLEAHAGAGGRVEYGTTLEAFVDAPEGVTVRLRSAAGEERATARYVVGCDGASSTVRRLLGFDFSHASAASFAFFDVDVVGESAEDEIVLCLHENGPLTIVPIGRKRRRISAPVRDSEREATLDRCNELIGERGPWNVGAAKLHWGSVLRVACGQTPGLHKGAIFLAGDAAHVHDPLAGQGLNAGLADAANLAWKLDFALRGFATNDLLPSYTRERHSVVRDTLAAVAFASGVVSTGNAFLRGLRDWWLPGALGSPRFARALNARVAQLESGYGGSPIVAGAGRRAHDDRVLVEGRERRLYDALRGRYLLVIPASHGAVSRSAYDAFAEHYGGALDVTMSAEDAGAPLVRLVRPDGYVALESAGGLEPTPVLERLARVLATHVRRGLRAPGAQL